MTAPFEALPPQVIVLASADATNCIGSVLGSEMVFRIDLGDARDTESVIRVVARELIFPHEATGFDALLDLMSDLDWFGAHAGYVVHLDGLDHLRRRDSELLARLVALLPNLCDRWRSRGVPFRLVLRGSPATRAAVREVLDVANAWMEEAAKRPWLADIGPAEIIECVE